MKKEIYRNAIKTKEEFSEVLAAELLLQELEFSFLLEELLKGEQKC